MNRATVQILAPPLLLVFLTCAAGAQEPVDEQEPAEEAVSRETADGYRGIWFTLGQFSEHGDKYSGGLGTYTANHVPMAIYSAEADKTFFVYGGAKEGQRHLLCMASYYDHERDVVPRPTIVHDKQGVDDPHDNPSLCIDEQGHVWVFVSGRGRSRPGFIYRSTEPLNVEEFELVSTREITYPQPRWIEGEGLLHLFTKYTKGRELYWSTSPNGREWSRDQKFAGLGGSYQTSHQIDRRVITSFNMHPDGNVDRRTNLYFLQTDDRGDTWRNAQGDRVEVPLVEKMNAALVRDYQQEERLAALPLREQIDQRGVVVVDLVQLGEFREPLLLSRNRVARTGFAQVLQMDSGGCQRGVGIFLHLLPKKLSQPFRIS